MTLRLLKICTCLILSTVCRADDLASKRLAAAAFLPKALCQVPPMAVIGAVNVSPSSISFNSADPDVTPVNGSTTGTVSWIMNGLFNPWTLTVAAASPSFSGCPAVPVNAVTVRCNSTTPGLFGLATCAAGTFNLSTTPVTIASGVRQGIGFTPFIISLQFTFTDNWKYPANSSCNLNLIYTASGN